MKESVIAVVRAIFLSCTCFSTGHSAVPRYSFVYLETPPSLPSFPFFTSLVKRSPLTWAVQVGGCRSDTSVALPQAWSCPQALAAQWWGPTSFLQSAHSLLSSLHSSSSPKCQRQCALDDPGFPSVLLHLRVAASAASASLPTSA